MAVAVIMGAMALVVFLVGVYYASRYRWSVQVSNESDDEEEEGDGVTEQLKRMNERVVSASDEDDEEENVPGRSLLATLRAYWWGTQAPVLRLRKSSKDLLKRKHSAVRKYHKPYFYPLLDETVEWFAKWEASKNPTVAKDLLTSEPSRCEVDVRIEQPRKDLLDDRSEDGWNGLDTIGLASFHSNAHTVIPLSVN
ncbi:hypothetical protein Poli38472_002506 [Pythium oligandrum]|uniref:Uncharacterized protein n=1 Tax=Pythium oligandrum TaxID=41045 RepID=A0A8K1CHY6_PYTOL|nr:hypothetical protein Poli38472_002506 [Pythium oligandrum]|eukprot:TMW63565.1 hypothetical protein Poli38472_002506 [Pythium oligandrum]